MLLLFRAETKFPRGAPSSPCPLPVAEPSSLSGEQPAAPSHTGDGRDQEACSGQGLEALAEAGSGRPQGSLASSGSSLASSGPPPAAPPAAAPGAGMEGGGGRAELPGLEESVLIDGTYSSAPIHSTLSPSLPPRPLGKRFAKPPGKPPAGGSWEPDPSQLPASLPCSPGLPLRNEALHPTAISSCSSAGIFIFAERRRRHRWLPSQLHSC